MILLDWLIDKALGEHEPLSEEALEGIRREGRKIQTGTIVPGQIAAGAIKTVGPDR